MAVLTLDHSITDSGMYQKDLIDLLTNLVTVVNELVDDHATERTEVVAIGTTLADIKAIYDAHTHELVGKALKSSPKDLKGVVGQIPYRLRRRFGKREFGAPREKKKKK